MATYRESRNIEATVIDFLTDQLEIAGWQNINVVKGFNEVYSMKVENFSQTGAISVRLSDTIHEKVEIGSTDTRRTVLIFLDIFATSDGQRLDIKDFLISILKQNIDYYEYTTSGSKVTSKIANGRLVFTEIKDSPIDLGVNKSLLSVQDRYRHFITLTGRLGKVEN